MENLIYVVAFWILKFRCGDDVSVQNKKDFRAHKILKNDI